MSGSVLVLVLTLISVDGDAAQLDEGLLDGLRPGDTGTVYYELSVGGARREIEVGTATVLDSNEAGATLRVPESARPGHRVRFELPLERSQAATLIDVARERLSDERFAEVLTRLLDRLIPADPALEHEVLRVLEARTARRQAAAGPPPPGEAPLVSQTRTGRAAEPGTAPEAPGQKAGGGGGAQVGPGPRPEPAATSPPEVAQRPAPEPALVAPPVDPEAGARAPAPVEVPTRKTPVAPPRPVRAEPAPPPAAAETPPEPTVASAAERGSPGVAERLRVPAGSYAIGLDLADAQFYSQHPRFRIDLASFAIDRRPVSRAEYLSFDPAAVLPGTSADEMATGVTFAEAVAYCAARGGRLPSEFEWEAAMAGGELETGLLEWTDSWYQPYPGNQVAEEEYGEIHRVLRGSPHPAQYDIRRRRFATPSVRHLKLGFRCAAG